MEDHETVTRHRFGDWTLTIDAEANCAYLERRADMRRIDRTQYLGSGINIDYDTANSIVGIEILSGVTD